MKTTLAIAVITLGLAAGSARAEQWKNVSIVDAHCAGTVKADPDAHSRSCALQCSHYGYGMITSDGRYIKFDATGNKDAKEALEASTMKDHLRATVEGQLTGNVVKVQSISFGPSAGGPASQSSRSSY
jgi:hypothetical protein